MPFLFCQILRHRGEDRHPVILATQEDLYAFNWFQRKGARELIQFTARECSQRTKQGTMQSIHLGEIPYTMHVFHRFGGLVCASLTDGAYEERVIFDMMKKVLRKFNETTPDWKRFTSDTNIDAPWFHETFVQYQNPEEVDSILQIQNNLNNIREVMHNNIEEVLKRGEELDVLMQRSQDLSVETYGFYRKARQMNSCCNLV